MINPRWLELPLSRTIFYGPKDVQAIEVRLYLEFLYTQLGKKLFIQFTVWVFHVCLSIYMCASFPFGFEGGMCNLIVLWT